MADWSEVMLRLGGAAAIGGMIGLNRNLHHKSTGLRTLSLVGLGAAVVTLMASDASSDFNAVSRVLQGVITGIGFLGAGVIVREPSASKISGLTTAATIWLTACLGAVCGLGAWRIALVAFAIVAVVLVLGGRLEDAVHGWLGRDDGHGKGNSG